MISNKLRIVALAATAAVAVGALAGCSGGSGGDASGAASGTYTWWDPYPQHTDGSDWAKRVQACGTAAGVTIQRTAYDTTALTNQALLSAQEGTSPDVILIDNPAVSTLAQTGMLTTTDDLGLSTADIDKNLLAAGQLDGKTYGIPIGANTLALYYKRRHPLRRGLSTRPPSRTGTRSTRPSRRSPPPARRASPSPDRHGGRLVPVPPLVLGRRCDLTKLDSPQAVQALTLWTNWVKQGTAPQSVITNSQNTTWEEFLTGNFAFGENGTWQVNSAAKAPFKTGVIQIPALNGGGRPGADRRRVHRRPRSEGHGALRDDEEDHRLHDDDAGFVDTANTFAYYIPPTAAAQQELLQQHPDLKTWVAAVQAAKGRTSDNLGTKYPKISEQLWTAVQSALSGASSPQDALTAAQKAAAAATK